MIDPRLERIFILRETRDMEIDSARRVSAERDLRAAIEDLLVEMGITEMSWRELMHQTGKSYLAWRRRQHR